MIARVRSAILIDRYRSYCAAVIGIWLIAWMLVFRNLYGWLTDDATVYDYVKLFAQGGVNVFDIRWFHAYMWFIVGLPTALHFSVPSQIEPRAWAGAKEFRGLILVTIFFHAALLGIVAAFLRQLCRDRVVAALGFTLFALSPVFNFYADLLDSRYLGLLAGVPALMILLRQRNTASAARSWRAGALDFGLPGILIAVGQSIHYTELYFVVPVAAVFWGDVLIEAARSADRERSFRRVAVHLAAFVAGLLAWLVPIELLSLHFHPFSDSMLGVVLAQVQMHVSGLTRIETLETWGAIFATAMGWPMVAAVLAGLVVLAVPRLRPASVDRVTALTVVGSTVLANVYFLASPTFPFYRQHSGYQIFYCLLVAIAIRFSCSFVSRREWRPLLALGLTLLIAYVPVFRRLPEVFVAQQGLGRAINFAHQKTYTNNIVFIGTYDWDSDPKSINSRAHFDRLRESALLITDMPLAFRLRFPDLSAQIDATVPLAAFPTLWCTREAYAEVQAFFHFRKWYDEPGNCEARVYRVADIRRQRAQRPLAVTAVSASGSLGASYAPAYVFDQPPSPPPVINAFYGIPASGAMWAAKTNEATSWLAISFARPVVLGRVVVEPADFYAPPSYHDIGRIGALAVYGRTVDHARETLLWRHDEEQDQPFIDAVFAPARVTGMRFVVTPIGPDRIAAIQTVLFPGHPVALIPGRAAPR